MLWILFKEQIDALLMIHLNYNTGSSLKNFSLYQKNFINYIYLIDLLQLLIGFKLMIYVKKFWHQSSVKCRFVKALYFDFL